MPRKSVEDVTKLPEWAQMRIRSLESNADYWKKRAFQAAPERVESNVVINESFMSRDGNLPDDARVRFYFDGKSRREFIECSMEAGGLRLYGNSVLVISCYASNVCTVNTQG
jgi:hypothetical protein